MCFQRLFEERLNHRLDDHLFDLVVEEGFPFAQTVSPTVSGEPFLDPRIARFLAGSRRHGVKVAITTNGTIMPMKIVERYFGDISSLNVSLNAATESTYRSICVGGDFMRVLENIRRFNLHRQQQPPTFRPALTLSFVMMRRNIEEMPRFVQIAKELGADHVIFPQMTILSPAMEAESLVHDPSLANRMIAEAEAVAKLLGMAMAISPARIEPDPEAPGTASRRSAEHVGSCPFLWKHVWVEWTGDVVPCCRPSPPRPTMGRIGQQSLRDIWNGEMYQRMRRGFRDGNLHPACRHCPHRTNRSDTRTAKVVEA